MLKRSLSDTDVISYIIEENCSENKLFCDLEPVKLNFDAKPIYDNNGCEISNELCNFEKIPKNDKKVAFENTECEPKKEKTNIKRRNRYCIYNPKVCSFVTLENL